MTSAQGQGWRRLHNWADVIHADFQTVISRVQQNISTNAFCTAERMVRTVMLQNSRLIQACFPIKIDEVWIDRFCVRYDWWRRLQRTSSVSPVCIYIYTWYSWHKLLHSSGHKTQSCNAPPSCTQPCSTPPSRRVVCSLVVHCRVVCRSVSLYRGSPVNKQ